MDATESTATENGDGGHDVFVGVSLALIGICVVIVAIVAFVRGGPDGHVWVSAVVTDVETSFEWNPARQKRELVTRPTVRFADPASGREHLVKLTEIARPRVGSTMRVSVLPGSPRTARLGGAPSPAKTVVIAMAGLGLVALGVSTARPSPTPDP